MAVLMFSSSWNDTFTNDEVPHLGAGFAYLRKSDYRLNPEHPPLMKDLGGAPLLLLKLHVDWNHKSWMEDPFGQWDFGWMLIANSGKSADTITRAAKAPLIVFTVALGLLIFWWTRQQFGDTAAMLALFFYTFSPTFLAHGRLVTTDVGAAAGLFVGTIGFLRFLKNPTWRNVALAGLAMGFAFLTKFSTIMLIPIALILSVAWTLADANPGRPGFFRFRTRPGGSFVAAFRAPHWLSSLWRCLKQTACIFALSSLVVYAVYLHHILKYPAVRQQKDAEFTLNLYEVGGLSKQTVLWATGQPVLRPWAEYLLGLVCTLQRSAKGNSLFFLGKIYENGSRLYFPFVYLVKEPLALHLLTILAVAAALYGAFFCVRRPVVQRERRLERLRELLQAHFTEFALLAVIAIYWWAAIRSNLNIGVRHVLPSFPFIFILVANQIARLRQRLLAPSAGRRRAAIWSFRLILGALLSWHAVSVLRVHPSYIAYFNEMAGGPDGGWRYVADSNVDWGQDLKRLSQFVDQRGISQIHLDYFGAADPAYYLKGKYLGLSSCSEPVKGWVAVSAMSYPDSRRKPECDYRRWLPMEKLVTKIGYSTFVFHIE